MRVEAPVGTVQADVNAPVCISPVPFNMSLIPAYINSLDNQVCVQVKKMSTRIFGYR